MATYAMRNDQLVKVTGLGERARCHDPRCDWEMIARPGNGHVQPHWAHRPGSNHIIGSGEKGEWHLEVQSLFQLHGARLEVEMVALSGRVHRADIKCANGIIVEAQTGFLNPAEIESREATYGEMLWLYDASDEAAWFTIDNDPGRFWWRKPDRRFFTHTKPIYFDTPTGVWKLETLAPTNVDNGRKSYHGTRRKVAGDLLEFVELVTTSTGLGLPARMTAIDARRSIQGTRAGTPQDVHAWLLENPICHYDGDIADQPLDTPESLLDTIRAEEPALEIVDDDHEPLEFTCPRCNTPAQSRFYGPCPTCRTALRAKYRAVL